MNTVHLFHPHHEADSWSTGRPIWHSGGFSVTFRFKEGNRAMILEVQHLSLVRAVAEAGSVSRAGVLLNLSQSALSHQLLNIEDRLGVPLFLRHNKRMTLTAAGTRLLQSAGQILDELQRTEEDIRRIDSKNEGLLRISTECYTSYHWLPPVLKSFHRKFPNVEIQIVAEATSRPIDYLVDGKLDIAIVPWTIRDRRIMLTPLFQDRLVVIVHPGHPLAGKRFAEVEDFNDQHLFMYSDRERLEDWTYYNAILVPRGVSVKRITNMQLTEGILEMVKAGLGIAVLAQWAAEPEIRRKSIVALPLTRKGTIRQWSAATLRKGPMPPYLDIFIKQLGSMKTPVMKRG
jgi:LysR family transcriptional regulator for metE and metH